MPAPINTLSLAPSGDSILYVFKKAKMNLPFFKLDGCPPCVVRLVERYADKSRCIMRRWPLAVSSVKKLRNGPKIVSGIVQSVAVNMIDHQPRLWARNLTVKIHFVRATRFLIPSGTSSVPSAVPTLRIPIVLQKFCVFIINCGAKALGEFNGDHGANRNTPAMRTQGIS